MEIIGITQHLKRILATLKFIIIATGGGCKIIYSITVYTTVNFMQL